MQQSLNLFRYLCVIIEETDARQKKMRRMTRRIHLCVLDLTAFGFLISLYSTTANTTEIIASAYSDAREYCDMRTCAAAALAFAAWRSAYASVVFVRDTLAALLSAL